MGGLREEKIVIHGRNSAVYHKGSARLASRKMEPIVGNDGGSLNILYDVLKIRRIQ